MTSHNLVLTLNLEGDHRVDHLTDVMLDLFLFVIPVNEETQPYIEHIKSVGPLSSDLETPGSYWLHSEAVLQLFPNYLDNEEIERASYILNNLFPSQKHIWFHEPKRFFVEKIPLDIFKKAWSNEYFYHLVFDKFRLSTVDPSADGTLSREIDRLELFPSLSNRGPKAKEIEENRDEDEDEDDEDEDEDGDGEIKWEKFKLPERITVDTPKHPDISTERTLLGIDPESKYFIFTLIQYETDEQYFSETHRLFCLKIDREEDVQPLLELPSRELDLSPSIYIDASVRSHIVTLDQSRIVIEGWRLIPIQQLLISLMEADNECYGIYILKYDQPIEKLIQLWQRPDPTTEDEIKQTLEECTF